MLKHILTEGAGSLGLKLPEAALEGFKRYFLFLEEKNRVMNLTAISGERDVAQLHFLDCLELMTLENFNEKRLIDIGSGAGFPGVPIKLAEPTVKLTLLDSQQKRVDFLKELTALLKLEKTACVYARAEEASIQPSFRGTFDAAVSRAVARLNVLNELCLPFLKPGGFFIAMKGTDSDEELREAEHSAKILGAQLERVSDYTIPGTDVRHRAVLFRKIGPTPEAYPRRFAKIQKNPL